MADPIDRRSFFTTGLRCELRREAIDLALGGASKVIEKNLDDASAVEEALTRAASSRRRRSVHDAWPGESFNAPLHPVLASRRPTGA
jgi:hypothetical protein